MSILSQFRDTIQHHQLLRNGDRLLLGVSGGPDSLAMLYLFNGLKKSRGLKIYVAHLNHGLRKEAQADLNFVKKICQELEIPFISEKIRIPDGKGSLEEKAREARMDFLTRTAHKIKAHTIVLGHTKDDQAETVLMRLLRGSGLSGLSGIIPKRKIRNTVFIRPLIEIERKEIENYLKRIRVKPRLDITNRQLVYFRNRIRHKLLPLLDKGYNRNVKAVLANAAQTIGADYDYIHQQGVGHYKSCVSFSKAKRKLLAKIDLKKITNLHPAMQRMVLRLGIEKMKGNTRRITFQHLKEIEDLIHNRKTGSLVDLPNGVFAKKEREYLWLVKASKKY